MQNNDTTYRKGAKELGISRSSMFRQAKRIESRKDCLGANFFESEEGQIFLKKLVVVTVSMFNILCGIRAKKISQVFEYIGINKFVGTSESSLTKLAKDIENAIIDYGDKQDEMVKNNMPDRPTIIGIDETFFNDLTILVGMDMTTGYIFCESNADDRTYESWNNTKLIKF